MRRGRFDGATWLLLALLMVWVGLGFVPAQRAEFVMVDDNVYLFRPEVLGGLTKDNVLWAWGQRHLGYWIPLTWTSLQVDGTITGWLQGRTSRVPEVGEALPWAGVYHVHNMILHGVGAGLLFLALVRMTGRKAASLVAAGLWAVHPLRVESVLWVTERKDVLAGMLGFLTLFLYVEWQARQAKGDRGTRGLYVLLCGAYAASLLAKPTLFMTLPVLLLLLDWWPLGRLRDGRELHRRIDEKWALWLLTVALAGLSVVTQREMGSVVSLDTLPLGVRVQTATISYVRYLVMQVACTRLGVWYPYPPPAGVVVTAGALLLLAGVTAFCWWQRRRMPWLWVGWLWYGVALVHLIGIVQTGLQGYADRFTYVPAVGLALMVAFSVPEEWFVRRGWVRTATWGTVGGLAVVMVVLTARQAGYWQNSERLFTRTLEVTGENPFIEGRLKAARAQRGDR